jgi:hypothetical protein
MKVYTEQQLTKYLLDEGIVDLSDLANDLLPHIELPSDEEVEKFIDTLPFTKGLDDGQYNDGVIYGAIIGIDWMRNKTQGGNK